MAYWQRHRIAAWLPEDMRQRISETLARTTPAGEPLYSRLHLSDWRSAVQNNLTSPLFDIEANIREGDSRAGLDEQGVQEVQRIMEEQGVVRRQMAGSGADPCRALTRRGCGGTVRSCPSTMWTRALACPWMPRRSPVCNASPKSDVYTRFLHSAHGCT